jgi:hypothetical protein
MKLSKIWQFFQDGDGALSATRLVFLGWNFAVIGLVTYTTFVLKQPAKVDTSIVGILATVMIGKVGQSFTENRAPATPTTPTV